MTTSESEPPPVTTGGIAVLSVTLKVCDPVLYECRALLGVRSVIGDVVHVQVAVGARRSALGVVEEGHRDGVCARRPVALEA